MIGRWLAQRPSEAIGEVRLATKVAPGFLSGDEEARPVCADREVAFTAYSPLASGALTGRYPRDGELPADSRLALRPDGNEKLLTPAVHDAIDRLRDAADGHGVECGALALAWLLHQTDVSAPIIGPARLRPHLGLAASALDVSLSDDEAAEIASWFA
jgi:1-deoxyxylulose-5-phosphate synthase